MAAKNQMTQYLHNTMKPKLVSFGEKVKSNAMEAGGKRFVTKQRRMKRKILQVQKCDSNVLKNYAKAMQQFSKYAL